MYWTEESYSETGEEDFRIRRADLDGSGLEDIVTLRGSLGTIALDIVHEKMYWTEPGFGTQGRIWRANLDGSGVEVVVTLPAGPFPLGAIALGIR